MPPRSEYSDDLPAIERYRIVLGAVGLRSGRHKLAQPVRAGATAGTPFPSGASPKGMGGGCPQG